MSVINDNLPSYNKSDNIPYFDVLILGAGVSGLTAAYKIWKTDDTLKIGILEANDRVGGRTQGISLRGATGTDEWDLGGQWIGQCQLEVMKLIEELNLPLYDQYCKGKRLLQVGDEIEPKVYSGDIPRLSWGAIFDLYFFISNLEGMMEKLGTDNEALFNQWDAMTVKSFIDRKLWTRESRESIEAALRVVFGCETCHLSLLYLLRYANSAGGFGPLISEKPNYGAQEMKIQGGTFQICPRIVEFIGEDKILLNQRVTHINQAFWRSSGYSGSVVSNGGRIKNSKERGPICLVYDATTYKGNPALVSFIGGQQHLEHSSKSDTERKDIVLHSLSVFFGPLALEPLDYVEKNWSSDNPVFIDGGPVSVGTPGIGHFMNNALREPFQNIHFAGTESATYWCGFINGAVESGNRAAIEVLYNIKPSLLTNSEIKNSRYQKEINYEPAGKFDMVTRPLAARLINFTLKVGIFVAGVLVFRKAFNNVDKKYISLINLKYLKFNK